jgi:hypothetical protein
MIQRIQTIYLALVATFCAAMFCLPMASFKMNDSQKYYDLHFNLSKTVNVITGEVYPLSPAKYIAILVAILFVLTVFIVFLYKNRPLQLKLTQLNILLHILLIGALYFFIEGNIKLSYTNAHISVTYLIAGYFPPLSLLLLILASRGIKKDEDLVRSSDRLR